MNFSCIFLLALAVFGTTTHAYIGSGALGYGAPVGGVSYNGVYDGACGGQYGVGYGAGYEGGYGCRPGCAPACASAAVCDSCQCLKTIVRPNVIERIPYSCGRRVQTSACRSPCGLYSGAGYGAVGGGAVGGAGYGGYLY